MRIPRAAGDVVRYHCLRVHHRQTIAHHVWNILRIYFEIWGTPSGKMLQHIMLHDVEEYGTDNNGTGDVPHPVKQRRPEIRRILHEVEAEVHAEIAPDLEPLSEEEVWRLRVCDLLEMWEFGRDEARMGNVRGEAIRAEAGRVVLQMCAEAENTNPVHAFMRRHR